MAVSQSSGRVRVVRLLHVKEGMEEGFISAYEQVRKRVAATPGHMGEQLCRSVDTPGQWMLTSEWKDTDALKQWRTSPEHEALVKSMNTFLHGDRSTTLFNIME
ncbi:antibiotic biosynthesis monooxygenase family protein [Streptomyces sp. NPDC057445]|uniref:antibiotic biosynthesis monooxygenase family protein n=1 Tax=Streptomyces sp. NPDC057445 TaxID=3346136 RepID=UPI0036B3A37C